MLQELLEKNQITQQALAKKLNVSQQAVSKWNKQISTPNPNQIDKISKVLQVPIAEVVACFTEKKEEGYRPCRECFRSDERDAG